jgi:hypothetical protein
MASGFRKGGRKLAALGGIALVGGAVAFFIFQGHFKAVPFFHDMMYDQTAGVE